MSSSGLLIIGGSDAGISAALRAREVAPATNVTVMLADDFPNYSICGLSFFLSGEVRDWHNLAHRTRNDIMAEGIHPQATTLIFELGKSCAAQDFPNSNTKFMTWQGISVVLLSGIGMILWAMD